MYKTSSGLYMLAFFGDCLDGHIARQNNTNTKLREYYDCSADILTFILSIYFIAKSLNEQLKF